MTPEERQMLSGLFERIRSQANGPRDPEAEAFIQDAVRQQPYAPYLLAQTVLVQEQGLSAANQRIQELEAQVRGGASGQRPSTGSFLGDLGRSIFGGGQQSQPSQPQASASRYQPQPSYDPPRGYPPAQPGPAGGPWGQGASQGGAWAGAQAPMAPQRSGGSSFLHGALGTAAGVAGGVLLADSMRNLFSSHSATAATMAGDAGGLSDWGGGAAGSAAGASDWGAGGAGSAAGASDWGSGSPGSDVAGDGPGSDWGSGSDDVASNDGGSDWGGDANDGSLDV